MKKPATTDPHKVIGYLRVSTDEQTLGPEAQRAALERWCEAHQAALIAVYSDQGVSGGAALDKRPALLAAIAALKEHGAGVLLVAKRARLARDTMLAAMVERLAEREGATVLTADGAGDGDGPEAVLMRRIVDAFAEYERLLIKARTRAALAVKRSRGERTGDIPYGAISPNSAAGLSARRMAVVGQRGSCCPSGRPRSTPSSATASAPALR